MAVSGTGQGETPQSLAAPAFAGFPLAAESGTKAALTTGMTTDRKIFQSHKFCAIMVQNQISGYSAVGSALDLGSRGRAFESLYSDQTMIIRTTLSKWVMCSDLSFLSKAFCDEEKQGEGSFSPCFFICAAVYF